MNSELPPIDSDMREQLARRAARRLPDGLLSNVTAALDGAPSDRPRRLPMARLTAPASWRSPRLAAATSMALIAVLAVAVIAIPRFVPTPASAAYPADRALTTAELASILAGPPLAVNTTLVVSTTIDVRTYVCPMNRYPTVGTIRAIGPQVCVMGATLAAQLPGPAATGVFAFRYLGPGYLGLLGEIKPAADSRLAFSVADDWPLGGKTFLVEGWLGADAISCPTYVATTGGDPLDPDGADQCEFNWMSDADPNPQSSSSSGGLLPVPKRLIEAGGMRLIDDVPGDAPVHGVFVVRSVAEQCSNASPQSDVGCSAWRVLAKVADVALPKVIPTATPQRGTTWDQAQHPLTTAELGAVEDTGILYLYDTIVADVKVQQAPAGACSEPTGIVGFAPGVVGVVTGLDPPVCLYAATGTTAADGILVLRSLGPRQLGYMATVTPAANRLAYGATDQWPDGFFLVQGWLDTDANACGASGMPAFGGPQPLSPGYDAMCHAAISSSAVTRLSAIAPASATAGSSHGIAETPAIGTTSAPAGSEAAVPTYPVPPDGRAVDAAPYFEFTSTEGSAAFPGYRPTSGSVSGVFLVGKVETCMLLDPADCETWSVLAKIRPLTIPSVPTAAPTTAQPPATPVIGGSYPADRPLTTDQLARSMAAGIAKDQVVVAQVTFATMNGCPGLGSYQSIGLLASTSLCVVGIDDGDPNHSPVDPSQSPVGASGVYAFRVLNSTTLGFMATVDSYVNAGDSWPAGKTIVVTGWVDSLGGIYSCPMQPAVSPEPLDPGTEVFDCGPQLWLYPEQFPVPLASEPPASAGGHPVMAPDYPDGGLEALTASRQTYLVRDVTTDRVSANSPPDRHSGWQIMDGVDPLTVPPAPAATATPTPALSGIIGSGERPLTEAEFAADWAAAQDRLTGRIAIIKGPVPVGFQCTFGPSMGDAIDATCHGTPLDGTIAPEGYWAVKVGADGRLSIVGELATPQSGFVFTLAQAQSANIEAGRVLIVDAWLDWANDCDVLPTQPNSAPCEYSLLTPQQVTWMHMRTLFPYDTVRPLWFVQGDAYTAFGAGNHVTAAHGLYLVTVPSSGDATILARLEPIT
ncbi:MAG TPA: hypothetical protein VGE81_03110 [Candidatus Limnocylindrales bacterium]